MIKPVTSDYINALWQRAGAQLGNVDCPANRAALVAEQAVKTLCPEASETTRHWIGVLAAAIAEQAQLDGFRSGYSRRDDEEFSTPGAVPAGGSNETTEAKG